MGQRTDAQASESLETCSPDGCHKVYPAGDDQQELPLLPRPRALTKLEEQRTHARASDLLDARSSSSFNSCQETEGPSGDKGTREQHENPTRNGYWTRGAGAKVPPKSQTDQQETPLGERRAKRRRTEQKRLVLP